MYYEINVSLHGLHFFATAERSITDEDKARTLVAMFRDKFRKEHGYEIRCTRWDKVGEICHF